MRVTLRDVFQCVVFGVAALIAGPGRAQLAPAPPKVPRVLRPPKDQVLILHLSGKGSQVYVCQSAAGAYTWKLKAPEAKLFGESGELAGRHFAGPTWEANDGSRVVGQLMASLPSRDSDSIPWLLLTAISHDETGIMARVQSIQRLDTKGGLAPNISCGVANKNEAIAVPYAADYYFYGIPRPGLQQTSRYEEP